MTTEEIFNLFLLISALHGFLFYFILLFSKKNKGKSLFYINFLVLVMSLNNMQSWFLSTFFVGEFFINYIHFPWHFLIAPLFYTFLIYYLEIEQKSKNLLNITVTIFLVLILIRNCYIYFSPQINTSNFTYLITQYNSIEEIVSLIVSLLTFGYSFHILFKKEKIFIKILTYDNLKWIYAFFKFGLFTYLFWIVALAITVALDFKAIIYFYFPLRVLTTIIIYWISYQAIFQLRLMKERKGLRKQLNKDEKTTSKNQQSKESNTAQRVLFEQIDAHIIEQQLFTEPKLTVEIVANQLDMSTSKISQVIKQFTCKNFNDFINEHRIQLAKNLLRDQEYKQYTITAIGLESGFNSKSSFYATFKKHTGNTPLVYQKNKKSLLQFFKGNNSHP